MTRLHLHIGTNKTGTSAIQRHLASRADALAAAGVLYPRTGRSGDAHYGWSRALGFANRHQRVDAPDAGALRRELLAEARAARCDRIVLSSEDFVMPADVGGVRRLLADFDAFIVVYLRRHDHWWLSVYNQAVRMVADPPWPAGGVGPYIRFASRRRGGYGNYRLLVDRWAKQFGADRIIVRPFEAAQNPGGVVADFLRTVGCEGLQADARDSGRVNESLSAARLALVDVVQRARITPQMRQRVLAQLLALPDEGPALTMRPALRRQLIDRNRADYEYIARTYLRRPDGVLFTEPEPSSAEAWSPPPRLDVVGVASTLLGMLDTPP